MYDFLRKHLPEKIADIALILWYLLLCIGIYIYSVVPDFGFIYLKL
jgi:hypothetical protein